MIIFLRHIPENATKEDILLFLKPSIKGGLFQKSGQVFNIEILILRDKETSETEFHALVTINPEKTAQRVIKQLNRKSLLGKRINLREYIDRTWHNDHRFNNLNTSVDVKERRIKDRRRGSKLEVINNYSIKTSSQKIFNRKFQ